MIENARHEKLGTPITISVPTLRTNSLHPFSSMLLVYPASILLQSHRRYRRYIDARSKLGHEQWPNMANILNNHILILNIFVVDFLLIIHFVLRTNRWGAAGLFSGTLGDLHYHKPYNYVALCCILLYTISTAPT